jgi:hypothetical protein
MISIYVHEYVCEFYVANNSSAAMLSTDALFDGKQGYFSVCLDVKCQFKLR